MSVARSYARALFDSVRDKNGSPEALTAVGTELKSFADAATLSKDLSRVLYGPVANATEKTAVIRAIGEKMGVGTSTLNFLTLLARKSRLSLLPEIVSAWDAVRLSAEGGVQGELATAEAISDNDVRSMADAFSKKLNKKVAFKVSVDPTLLAGVKITVAGVTYDGTLKSQLQRLRERVAAGPAAAHRPANGHA